ncbi:hypothetical protein RNJ44_01106 [Nakaseomyces bracarensis]|uniref:Peroxisomal membrane protein PEX14-like KPWE domain-containing protein n=1 Tax=Nakaseomyces bracarensis TaxID=273131 RepID=A0ABR4NQZ0_9SACH
MALSYEEVLDHIVNNKPVPMEDVPDITLEEPKDSEQMEMKLKPWQVKSETVDVTTEDASLQMKNDMEQELSKAMKEGLHDVE